MKSNFKTAKPQTETVSVNTNKRHDYSHTKFLTTDVGRFLPVGFWELEPGEEIDFSKTFVNLESMPMLIDSKQSWEISLQFFACRKNVLWENYRKMKYPNYKQIQRSNVSSKLTPFFHLRDLAKPQIVDCVRFEANRLVPRSYLYSTSVGYMNNASEYAESDGVRYTSQKVIEDENGVLISSMKELQGIWKIRNADSAENPFNSYKIGKASIYASCDGFLCKNEQDFGLESTGISFINKRQTDYFSEYLFRDFYSDECVVSLVDGVPENYRLINFIRCNVTTSIQRHVAEGVGFEPNYIYALVAFFQDSEDEDKFKCIPLSFYVKSNDIYRGNRSLIDDRRNPYQFGSRVFENDGTFICVDRFITLEDLHISFAQLSGSPADFTWFQWITKYRNQNLVEYVTETIMSGYANCYGYLTGKDSTGTTWNIWFNDFPVAIASDYESAQNPDLVAFGVPNLLWRSNYIQKDIAFNDDAVEMIDATPLRMYHYVFNQFRKDWEFGEDFDFKGNGLFERDGEEFSNLSNFITDFAQLPSWIDQSQKNFQIYKRPNFGYYTADSDLYKKWFIGEWFLPQYVAREEDIFTYIKLECDPVELANVPVVFADHVETSGMHPVEAGSVFAYGSDSQSGVYYTHDGESKWIGSDHVSENLSYNLETERIVRRQASILYNILNGGRRDWELQFSMTGEYPTNAFVEVPSYLGGVTKSFAPMPLVNDAQSSENPLGFTQGLVSFNMQCKHVGLKVEEQTCVMAFVTIRPHNIYISDGVLPIAQRIGYEDQFAPEYADLAEEEVKGKVLNYQPFIIKGATNNHNDLPLGYLPRNTWLKGGLNRLCGDYRDNLQLFLNSYKPRSVEGIVIDLDFMTCKPHDYDSVFVINDGSDRWKLEVSFDMSVSRALSTNPQIKL